MEPPRGIWRLCTDRFNDQNGTKGVSNMAKTAIRVAAILGLFTVAACESSDLSRGAIGAGSGYLIDRAVGGDGMVGAAVGATAGVVCDDVTPQYCN
jgi:hypothetical protein